MRRRTRRWFAEAQSSGCLCSLASLLVSLSGGRFLELASAHEEPLNARRCLLLLLILCRCCSELEGMLGAERGCSCRAYVQEGCGWSCLRPTDLLDGLTQPFLVRLTLLLHLLTLCGLGRFNLLAALFFAEMLGCRMKVNFELVGLTIFVFRFLLSA